MNLRNKKTGERGIINYFDNQCIVIYPIDENWNAKGDKKYVYHSLAELNAEWEDVPEERKGNWTIDPINEDCIDDGRYTTPDELERYEELGLKFNTEEEAEKAVEKLKAWKRLKDKGFRFTGWYSSGDATNTIRIYAEFPDVELGLIAGSDLDLLFGGEE